MFNVGDQFVILFRYWAYTSTVVWNEMGKTTDGRVLLFYYSQKGLTYFSESRLRVCCCGTVILSSFYNFKLCDDQGIHAMELRNLSKKLNYSLGHIHYSVPLCREDLYNTTSLFLCLWRNMIMREGGLSKVTFYWVGSYPGIFGIFLGGETLYSIWPRM